MRLRYKTIFPITRGIILIAWTLSLMGYFFQFPFSKLSALIVPCLAVYLIGIFCYRRTLTVIENWAKEYVIYFAYLVLMALVSVFQSVEFGIIIRFLLLLSIIPLFTVARLYEFKQEYDIFIFLAVVKCILLLYFAARLIRTGSYIQLRAWAEANHYGDIYINPYTHLPKVQVHGNGILPMAFILNVSYGTRSRKNNVINLILLLGILCAGNSAYILAIGAFYIYRLCDNITKSNKPKWIKQASAGVLLGGGAVFIAYAIFTLSMKSDYSDAVRAEQARFLMDNYILVGNGLGHKIFYSGVMRSYSGGTYYELQTLYIYNQIGLLGILLFYILTLGEIKRVGKKELILFLIYLLYTFFNPYCFDTTEMIVITLLVNYPVYIRNQEDLQVIRLIKQGNIAYG